MTLRKNFKNCNMFINNVGPVEKKIKKYLESNDFNRLNEFLMKKIRFYQDYKFK